MMERDFDFDIDVSQCSDYAQLKFIYPDNTSVIWHYCNRDGDYNIQIINSNGDVVFPFGEHYKQCDSDEKVAKGELPIYDGT